MSAAHRASAHSAATSHHRFGRGWPAAPAVTASMMSLEIASIATGADADSTRAASKPANSLGPADHSSLRTNGMRRIAASRSRHWCDCDELLDMRPETDSLGSLQGLCREVQLREALAERVKWANVRMCGALLAGHSHIRTSSPIVRVSYPRRPHVSPVLQPAWCYRPGS